MLVATWATSRAWVRRVRWWSSGKTNTWVLPASRRNGGGVEDAVPVALEAGPLGIGLLGPGPVAGTSGAGRARRQRDGLQVLAFLAARATARAAPTVAGGPSCAARPPWASRDPPSSSPALRSLRRHAASVARAESDSQAPPAAVGRRRGSAAGQGGLVVGGRQRRRSAPRATGGVAAGPARGDPAAHHAAAATPGR